MNGGSVPSPGTMGAPSISAPAAPSTPSTTSPSTTSSTSSTTSSSTTSSTSDSSGGDNSGGGGSPSGPGGGGTINGVNPNNAPPGWTPPGSGPGRAQQTRASLSSASPFNLDFGRDYRGVGDQLWGENRYAVSMYSYTVGAAEAFDDIVACYLAAHVVAIAVSAVASAPEAISIISAKLSTISIDKYVTAGKAMDRSGLTAAGRALQKHGSRANSIFPQATGNIASINKQGESVLKSILTNTNVTSLTRHHARFGNIMEFRTPAGLGARFSADGKTFIGFIEP